VLRSRSLSSGYRVANLAETAGQVAALQVVSQAVVDRTLAQAQAAHTACVEHSAVVYPWSSGVQGASAGARGRRVIPGMKLFSLTAATATATATVTATAIGAHAA
jgi:hypothetical protein